MILKLLKLENIRSYKQHEINFPLGTTLFEGDIGSGKSTILMSIEFALFGLGSEKAGALLRKGESKGIVNLRLEVNNEEYEIQRTLTKKGKSIQQADGFMKSKEGTLYLSATELKEKVLEILNFNEPPDPKAQSNIYRYAVFTPQEEMKVILLMSPDSRLQTLRKAFRIEDYKIARDNAQSLTSNIEKHADILRATASDLDEKKVEVETRQTEISEEEEELKTLFSQQQESNEICGKLKSQQESLKGERDKLSKVEGEIPEIEKQIKDKNKSKEDSEELAKKAQSKVDELNPKMEEFLKVEKLTDKSVEQLNGELKELRNRQRGLLKNQSAIDAKVKDYLHIEEEGVCPTCDRKADPTEFKNKVQEKSKELENITSLLGQCDSEIEQIQKLVEKRKEYDDAQKMINEYKAQLVEQQYILQENAKKAQSFSEQVEELKKRLEEAKKELEKFKELSEQLQQIDEEVDKANKVLLEIGSNVSSQKTKIEEEKKRVGELQEEVKAKEENMKKSNFLNEYVIWLRDFFIPTVENIERNVLVTLHQEFNELFQHWFSLLVEDPTKDAFIDEDFTPIVEQDGYEQDINFLSGGERTSVALAYRLALNMLVCKVSTGMKSSLLILDEPTDGFSKDQLFKIQDILKELQCPQIIIVSHEKELESFADQVFKVTKANGVSSVGV
jgi:exonuclease SbcC